MEYPEWKILAWRFGRVFISVFLVQLGTGFANLENSAEIYQALIIPAFSGALVALGKAIRDRFGEKYPVLSKLII